MIILTDENFEKEVNGNKDKLVLVDFFATWCEPCTVLGPILEKVMEQFKETVVLAKIDVGSAPVTAQKYEVEKIPTVILFKNGEPISGFVGLIAAPAIKEWLNNILQKEKEGKK